MQLESRVVSAFQPQPLETELDLTASGKHAAKKDQTAALHHDMISASVVIGLTAQFVAFIFGLVTDYVPSILENIVLSSFLGISVGLISYALMRDDREQ